MSIKTEIAWKVVRVDDDNHKLLSCFVGSHRFTAFEGLLETEYKIGEFVKAKYIALYCFSSEEEALNFAKCNRGIADFLIFKAEIVRSNHKLAFRFLLPDYNLSIKSWLDLLKKEIKWGFPLGTIACSKVKLIGEGKHIDSY